MKIKWATTKVGHLEIKHRSNIPVVDILNCLQTPASRLITGRPLIHVKKFRNSEVAIREFRPDIAVYLWNGLMKLEAKKLSFVELPIAKITRRDTNEHSIITLFKKGTIPLPQVLNDSNISHDAKLKLSRTAGELVAKMHHHGIIHGHPHFDNFLVYKHPLKGFELKFVDYTLIGPVQKSSGDPVFDRMKYGTLESDIAHLRSNRGSSPSFNYQNEAENSYWKKLSELKNKQGKFKIKRVIKSLGSMFTRHK